MNIASAGKVLSFEGGFSTLSKAKLNLNVAAESLHDGEETLLLAIILWRRFLDHPHRRDDSACRTGTYTHKAIVKHQAEESEGNTEKQR